MGGYAANSLKQSLSDALTFSFGWSDTKERYFYWRDIRALSETPNPDYNSIPLPLSKKDKLQEDMEELQKTIAEAQEQLKEMQQRSKQ